MKHYNIPIFVPHIGCPNDCSFCNQKKITGKKDEPSTESIAVEVEKCLSTSQKPSYIEIAFFGGSFTGICEETQKNFLDVAKKYVDEGKVQGIRLSTRPDYINSHILDYLKFYGVTAIELGVQSMDDEVLLKNNRGHSTEQVIKAVNLIKSYGCFELGLQQMLGLYGSSAESDIKSAEIIASLMPDTVRIYPTIVLPDTYLCTLFNEGKYTPYTLEIAVDVGSKAYKIYTSKNIRVIRLGLQSTEIINEKEKIIGPYHSSYGELVKSRVIRDEIEEKINGKDMTIFANKKYISKILGNKRENINYFKNKYGVKISVFEQSDENYYKIINMEK